MEVEFFVPPDEAATWFEYWLEQRFSWYLELGIPETHLRKRFHEARRAEPLLGEDRGHRVPLPVGLG